MVRAFGHGNYWIGLNDIETEGEWRWVNGHRGNTNDHNLWIPGQPNNGNANQDCGRLHSRENSSHGLLVSDEICDSQVQRAICEKLIT